MKIKYYRVFYISILYYPHFLLNRSVDFNQTWYTIVFHKMVLLGPEI